MTAGARGNGFTTALDRLSLWNAIKKLMGHGANRRGANLRQPPTRTLTTEPDSTILKIERGIFFSLFGRPELSQVIRTHLLDTAKIGAFHAVPAWTDPVRSLETLKAPPVPVDCPPVRSIRARMLCWLYPNRGW